MGIVKGQCYLVLDVSFLCWRAFHVMGHLSFKGVRTGVIFGLLRDIERLQDQFATKHVIFCFDRGRSLRVQEFSEYKGKRWSSSLPEDQQKIRKEVKRQIDLLRTDYLKKLGYRNIFHQYGYEADDIIASISSTIARSKGEAVIVAGDKDFYQLLSRRISLYCPKSKKLLTDEKFREEHGINPVQWVDVKAIAGCDTDNVPGIKGVGEKTAIKFLLGSLKPVTAAYKAIVSGNEIWERNRRLVELPFPGVKQFTVREDKVTSKAWNRLAKELGMKSLIDELSPSSAKDYRRGIAIKRKPSKEKQRKGFF